MANFKIGEVVWMKMGDYPWWPARVFDPDSAAQSIRREKRNNDTLVQFFETNDFSWVMSRDKDVVVRFEADYDPNQGESVDCKRTMAQLQRAIKLATEAFRKNASPQAKRKRAQDEQHDEEEDDNELAPAPSPVKKKKKVAAAEKPKPLPQAKSQPEPQKPAKKEAEKTPIAKAAEKVPIVKETEKVPIVKAAEKKVPATVEKAAPTRGAASEKKSPKPVKQETQPTISPPLKKTIADSELEKFKTRLSIERPKEELISVLEILDSANIDAQQLLTTKIGKTVNELRKHADETVKKMVKGMIVKWKEIVNLHFPAVEARLSSSNNGSTAVVVDVPAEKKKEIQVKPEEVQMKLEKADKLANKNEEMRESMEGKEDNSNKRKVLGNNVKQEEPSNSKTNEKTKKPTEPVKNPETPKKSDLTLDTKSKLKEISSNGDNTPTTPTTPYNVTMDEVKQTLSTFFKPYKERIRNTLVEKMSLALMGKVTNNCKTKCATLAVEIEAELHKTYFGDPKTKPKYQSQFSNIQFALNDQKNPDFRQKVYEGFISLQELATGNPKNWASKEQLEELRRLEDKRVNERLIPEPAKVRSHLYRCMRCKSDECSYDQRQTRSADESMTIFVYCSNCGNRWKK